MAQHRRVSVVAAALGAFVSPFVVRGAPSEVTAVEGPEAIALGRVTGYRSISHRKAGLEVRLLEADGSASVAQDPIALYLVVTNKGTSDLDEHVWRLPRGVARVRRLSETTCGVDVHVHVDGPGDAPKPRPVARILHLCFLSKEAGFSSKLQFSETVPKSAG